jgi:glucose-6-phosphate isomerase
MAARFEKSRSQSTDKQATWRALEDDQRTMRGRHLRTLFADDPARSERMTAKAAGVFLDYSKNCIR